MGHPGPAPSALSPRVARAVLLGGSITLLAILAYAGTWLTFWSDEWSFLFRRADPSVESLLRGNDVHLHLFPWLVYQSLYRLAGLGSYYPYLIVAWAFHLSCAWLLFALAGRLAGWGVGLCAGLSLLFLGSSYEVLLQPGQMGYALGEAMGLLAILLLLGAPAPGRGARATAALALAVGAASSGVGVIFAGLVALWAALRRDGWGVATALPALAGYGLWFSIWSERWEERLGWTPEAPAHVAASIVYGAGATVSAVLGLGPLRTSLAGLLIGAAILAVLLRCGARLDALGTAALVALAMEFALVAGFRPEFGVEWAGRSGYLHPAVSFVWLAAASLCADSGVRRRVRPGAWLVAAILIVAIAGNLAQLVGAARSMRLLRADLIVYLRLLEGLRGSPDLDLEERAMLRIAPVKYYAAIDRFGAPRLARREPTLAEPGAADRGRLDAALLKLVGEGIRPDPAARVVGAPPAIAVSGGRAEPGTDGCVRVAAGDRRATAAWTPGTGGFLLRGGGADALRAVRVGAFARPGQNLDLSALGDGDAPIRLPALPAPLRWSVEVEVTPGRAVTVCSAAGG